MIGDGSDVVVLGVAGCHRLWIEVLGIYEIGVLRADMEGGGDDLFGGRDEVELREGVEQWQA